MKPRVHLVKIETIDSASLQRVGSLVRQLGRAVAIGRGMFQVETDLTAGLLGVRLRAFAHPDAVIGVFEVTDFWISGTAA